MKAVLTVALTVLVAASAHAQNLKIAFNQGHVSVDATAVPARTILTEWGKLGGTKITGVERMTGAPLTLKLVDIPEAQALEIILRNAAGYMAAPRPLAVAGNTGSIYDRILVMATSTAPAAAAPARPTPANNLPGPANGTQRFIPPQRVVQAEPDEQEEPEEEPERPNQPVFTFPQPGQNGVPTFGPQGGQVISVDPRTGQPQTITISPSTQAPPPPAPTGAFGGVGSPTPGMIVQPPTQPGQPGPSVRPPGRQQQ